MSRLSVTEKQVWVPSLRQLSHVGNDFVISTAWLHENGTIYLLSAGAFLAYCDLNNYNWPLDQQRCVSTILATEHDASELELSLITEQVDLSDYNEHGSWELVDPKADIVQLSDKDVDIYLVAHRLILTLKRRPEVILLHSAIPFFLTALLNIVIYFVPVRSGERITFAVTVLLTFVFFTTSIAEDLPRTSVTTPYISVVMAIMNCLCTFNVLVSVVFSRLSSECIVPVPECLKKFTHRIYILKVNKLLGAARINPDNVTPGSSKSEVFAINDVDNDENLNNEDDSISNNKKEYDLKITWATVIDAFDFVIFYILLVIVLLVSLVYEIQIGPK